MATPRAFGRFDFVVVGGGTAGCLMANRLSRDPSRRVLLLEAGGRDWNPMLHIPSASGKLLRRGLHGWRYTTEADAGIGGRRLFWPKGKVLGGSSSINGMVYVRGHPSDYDHWAGLGNRGWSWEDVLPAFRRSERHTDRGGPLHGREGELRVERGSLPNPLFDAFVEAGRQAGFPVNDDFNGPEQEGFGRFDFNIAGGRRQSAAVAFLDPVRSRPNLAIVTRAHVTRLVVDAGRVAGVVWTKGGRSWTAAAAREVVLAAGTIGSPQILMLSGIGPGADLAAHGIPVVADLPGVGANLQDHGQVGLLHGCREPLTMHQLIRVDRAAFNLLRAALLRDGPFAQFPTQAGAFTRTRGDLTAPDVQWHFGNFLGVDRIRIPNPFAARRPLERDGYMIGVCLLRPESRGSVALRSADPLDAPLIRPNYLSSPGDMDVMVAAIGQARTVAAQPALARFDDGEIAPGPEVRTDDEIRAWIRSAFATVHHQVGTCRMGQGRDAVVDERLRLRGLAGLRIADASIMPTLVGGNTHAPVLMIAERCADFMTEDAGA